MENLQEWVLTLTVKGVSLKDRKRQQNMKKRLSFYLFVVPCVGVLVFFIFNIIAILQYPGYEKCIHQNIDSCIEYEQSDYYSFTHNFFSELGSIRTSTTPQLQYATSPDLIKWRHFEDMRL